MFLLARVASNQTNPFFLLEGLQELLASRTPDFDYKDGGR